MAFDQAKARYQAGLVPIDDLAQAQRLVVQAEIDDSLARLNVWRALLQLDAAVCRQPAREGARPTLQEGSSVSCSPACLTEFMRRPKLSGSIRGKNSLLNLFLILHRFFPLPSVPQPLPRRDAYFQ
jgi:outer membrane efflux protein